VALLSCLACIEVLVPLDWVFDRGLQHSGAGSLCVRNTHSVIAIGALAVGKGSMRYKGSLIVTITRVRHAEWYEDVLRLEIR